MSAVLYYTIANI